MDTNNDQSSIYLSLILSACYILLVRFSFFTTWDTTSQWQQVIDFDFNDWHPVTHTFCIWLITCVCRSYMFFLFVQGIIYAVIVSAIYKALRNYCQLKKIFALLVTGLIALHPAMQLLLRVAWKDTAMAIAFGGIVVCLIGISTTRGKWLQSKLAATGFMVSVLLGTLFRHNAFFFTFPLLFTLFLLIERKFWKRYFIILFFILVILGGVKFIIAQTCDAHSSTRGGGELVIPQRYGEAIGLPLGILANVARVNPDALPADVHEFMQKVASLEVWQKYELGNANSIKYQIQSGELANVSPANFLRMVIRTSIASPGAAISAIVNQAGTFWQVNQWPGFWVALLLFSGIWVFPVLKWKILPLTLPVFCYQAGTSLLMYSYGDIRFFGYTTVVCLPMTVLLLSLCHQQMFQNRT